MNKQSIFLLGLGLLVIVLMVAVLIFADSPDDSGTPVIESTTTAEQSSTTLKQDTDTKRARYDNAAYGIASIVYPRDTWAVLATNTVGLEPKLNVYKVRSGAATDTALPYTHFTNETHVSLYPDGIPTEGLHADRDTFNLTTAIEVDTESAVLFTLDDGTPFAAYVQPSDDNRPASWTEYGFVWARARVANMDTYCTRDGEQIAEEECDPLARGDEVHYTGTVDSAEWQQVVDVLTSLEFERETWDSQVHVDQPKEGALVQSPLSIRGTARGTWYFEATLPLELVTGDGTVLIESYAEAQGDWMTQEYVPFEAQLTFEAPRGVGEGVLRIHKANPSGLPENDAVHEVPVRF